MEILAKDIFADIRAHGAACTDKEGNLRSRGIVAEYRNLKRVSLAYARELSLTTVARKAFKLSYERESDLDKWIKLAYAVDEEPADVTPQPTEPEPQHKLFMQCYLPTAVGGDLADEGRLVYKAS